MAKIEIEIKSCQECPFFDKRRHYTEDSWELAFDWHCKKEDGKKIAGYVGWSEEKDVKVPEWCPIKTK